MGISFGTGLAKRIRPLAATYIELPKMERTDVVKLGYVANTCLIVIQLESD